MLVNKITCDRYNNSYGLIFLNFTNKIAPFFGCKNKCKFCSGRQADYNIRLCPTNDEITEYIQKYFTGCKGIQLSGAGDPLYNFEENKNEVLRIIKCLKTNGVHQIGIITGEFDVVAKYHTTLLKDITNGSFSCEWLNDELRNLAQTLILTNKYVAISKIYNLSSQTDSINYPYILEGLNFYNIKNLNLKLRENLNMPLLISDFNLQHIKLAADIKIYNANISLVHAGSHLTHLVLINNEVWHSRVYQQLISTGGGQ